MKRIIVFLIVMCIFTLSVSAQQIPSEIIDNAPEIVADNFSDENLSETFSLTRFINFLSDNLYSLINGSLKLIASLVAVLLLVSIYESLVSSFNLSKNSFTPSLICGLALSVTVALPLSDIIGEMISSVENMSDYIKITVPILCGITASMGNISSASLFHLFLYNGAVAVSDLFAGLSGLCGGYMALGISSQMSGNSGLKLMAEAVKKVLCRLTVILCLAFTGILSLQNVIVKAGDSVLKKTLKTAVGSALPVGGSVLTDALDTYLSGLTLLKGAGGSVAVISVFYFTALPILKAGVFYLAIQLCLILCGFVGSKTASGILKVVSDTYGILLTLSAAVTIMFIISLSVLVIGGSA